MFPREPRMISKAVLAGQKKRIRSARSRSRETLTYALSRIRLHLECIHPVVMGIQRDSVR